MRVHGGAWGCMGVHEGAIQEPAWRDLHEGAWGTWGTWDAQDARGGSLCMCTSCSPSQLPGAARSCCICAPMPATWEQ